MTAADEVSTTDVESKTFRLVRKGYDPHEVRRYLSKLAEEISVLRTRAETLAPPAPATVGGSTVSASESTDVAPSVDPSSATDEVPAVAPPDVPAAAVGIAAPADSDETDAAVPDFPASDPAASDPTAPDPTVPDPGVPGSTVSGPEATHAPATDESEGAAGGDRWAQMGRHVASVLAAAEREAASITANAEERATQRLAEVDGQVQASRTALREARRQLTEVHTLVGRSLSEMPGGPSATDPAATAG